MNRLIPLVFAAAVSIGLIPSDTSAQMCEGTPFLVR